LTKKGPVLVPSIDPEKFAAGVLRFVNATLRTVKASILLGIDAESVHPASSQDPSVAEVGTVDIVALFITDMVKVAARTKPLGSVTLIFPGP
jgi:hypothetical protein